MKFQQRSKTSQPHETIHAHKPAWRMATGLLLLASLILTAIPAQAGLLYWDVLQSKSGTGGGGTGNWNTTSLDWYPGSGSTDQAWSNTGLANTAAFAGTAGVVTLTSAISANRLTFPVGGYALTNNTLTLNGTAPTIDVKTGTTTIGSALAGGAGLVVSGTGNLILSGPNTYTKATTVNGGTLTLDFSQSTRTVDIMTCATTSERVDMNGGTLALIGKSGAVNSQSFIAPNGLSLRSACAVTLTQNGASSLSLNLLGISRNAGSTLDVTLPATGGIATTLGTANTLLTVSSVPFATINGVDWAAKDAANTKIVPGSSIAGFYTPSTATTLSGNADVASGVDTTISANTVLSSLRFNVGEARTITTTLSYILTPFSILVTENVGANPSTITGGRLRGAGSVDLVIIQNNTNSSLTIGATIMNNGSCGLTKSGNGRTILTGSNTYTGPSFLNDGTLSISSNANLGDPATGAAINFAGGTLLATETLALDNGGVNARNVTLLGKGGTFAVRAGKTLTVLGAIGNHANGTGPLTVGTDGETGTLLLTGTSTYTDPTFVKAGTLALNGTIVSPVTVHDNAVLTGTGSISATTATAAVTVNNGGILDPGAAGGIGTLAVSGNVAFANGSAFQVQANAAASDLLTVSGNVTSESNTVLIESTTTGSGPWKIMTATSIVPTFTASDPNMIVKKLFNDTELWLERNSGTVIVVR